MRDLKKCLHLHYKLWDGAGKDEVDVGLGGSMASNEGSARGRPRDGVITRATKEMARMRFCRQLRDWRKRSGVDRYVLASRLGVPMSTASRYETDLYPPNRLIFEISSALGVDVSTLAKVKLEHQEPDLFMALFGTKPWRPTRGEVDRFIASRPDLDDALWREERDRKLRELSE